MSIAVTASRPLIGSASAIAVYYFLTSDFGAVVLGLKEIKQNTIFTVAFASGFSERLVFSTTKKVIDRVGK